VIDSIHARLVGIEMGTNDLYLIKKLKESGVSIERMNSYLRKMLHVAKEIAI
jgi:hypothetical protein